MMYKILTCKSQSWRCETQVESRVLPCQPSRGISAARRRCKIIPKKCSSLELWKRSWLTGMSNGRTFHNLGSPVRLHLVNVLNTRIVPTSRWHNMQYKVVYYLYKWCHCLKTCRMTLNVNTNLLVEMLKYKYLYKLHCAMFCNVYVIFIFNFLTYVCS